LTKEEDRWEAAAEVVAPNIPQDSIGILNPSESIAPCVIKAELFF